jgi:uncharacterized protein (TIGR02996 family)
MAGPEDLQAAFLAAIRDNPDDDASRLIFADWLEEQGDPRGEFLRVQCMLAGMDGDDPRRAELQRHEAELLHQHSQNWLASPPPEIQASFQRGLLSVWVSAEVLGRPPLTGSARFLAAAARLGVTAQGQSKDQAAQWLLAQRSWVGELGLYSVADDSLRRAIARGLLAPVVALTLAYGPLTDAGLIHLAALTQLRKLSANLTEVTGRGLESLAALPRLQILDLGGPGITDRELVHLAGLTQLQALHLDQTPLTDEGLQHLPGLGQLRELDLSYTRVRGAGLKHLTRLGQLHKLSLKQTEVTGAGLPHLGNLAQFRELDLGRTRMKDAGLEHLAVLTQLQALDLHKSWVKGPGLEYLAGLTQLQKLDLGQTRVGDAGLEHLAALTQLQVLNLRDTRVTAARVEQLRQVLPGCRIVH